MMTIVQSNDASVVADAFTHGEARRHRARYERSGGGDAPEQAARVA